MATINNSKATFNGYNLSSAKFWLNFMASLWMNATHNSEECEAYYKTTLGVIENITLQTTDTQILYKAFADLCNALDELSSNSTLTKLRIDGDILRIGWDGSWTEGRYVHVNFGPGYSNVIVAEWDTATNSESSFLSLPSSAENFIASRVDPDAKIDGIHQEEVERREEIGAELNSLLSKTAKGFSFEKTEAGVKGLAERIAQLIQKRLSDKNVAQFADGWCYSAQGWTNICETYIKGSLKSLQMNDAVRSALWEVYEKSEKQILNTFKEEMNRLVNYDEMVKKINALPKAEKRTTVQGKDFSMNLPVDVIRLFYTGPIYDNTCVTIGRQTAEFLQSVG